MKNNNCGDIGFRYPVLKRERGTSRRRRKRENSSGEEVYKGAKKEERQKGREDSKGKRVQKGSESMKGNSLNLEREK